MHWDGTVTFGNVLEILAWLMGVGVVYLRLVERLIRIETKLDVLWNNFLLGNITDQKS